MSNFLPQTSRSDFPAAVLFDLDGTLVDSLADIAGAGVGIEYSYAFYSREQGKANIVLRVDDNEKVLKLIG